MCEFTDFFFHRHLFYLFNYFITKIIINEFEYDAIDNITPYNALENYQNVPHIKMNFLPSFSSTFCGKINIKPLSTADFGKVMKQVFPDIRPRRLGTRGHSRYCYAAMRKATKLNPPQLPDLSTSSNALARNSSSSGGGCVDGDDKDDVPWNVIKNWSENLLGTHFDSFDDLATHIKLNNHMTSSSTSTATSKQILQKKLMQREMKDRKRNIVSDF